MLKEVTAPLLTTQWGQRLGFFLAILFGILLLSSFIHVFLNISSTDDSIKQNRVNTSVTALEDHTAALIKQIPQKHLFGSTTETQSILPIARLPFALIGTIQSTSKNSSRAIISEAGKNRDTPANRRYTFSRNKSSRNKIRWGDRR